MGTDKQRTKTLRSIGLLASEVKLTQFEYMNHESNSSQAVCVNDITITLMSEWLAIKSRRDLLKSARQYQGNVNGNRNPIITDK